MIIRAAHVLAHRLERRLRQVWRAHHARVVSNTAYAAATATVIAGVLGMVAASEALAAVLGVALGVYANQQCGRSCRGSAWREDDWI